MITHDIPVPFSEILPLPMFNYATVCSFFLIIAIIKYRKLSGLK